MMMTMNGKAHFSSALDSMRRACLGSPQANIFAGLDESVLAAADLASSCHAAFKQDASRHAAAAMATHAQQHGAAGLAPPLPPSSLEAELLEHLSSSLVDVHAPLHAPLHAHPHHLHHVHAQLPVPPPTSVHVESDPRELEAFAERFKQRRVKLGVTQADVGAALASLNMPGVGALSQSTICRFESLTLSHNNMIALRPVLQAWLLEAEHEHERRRAAAAAAADGGNAPPGCGNERKRKRTSIAAPEKRSLEAYFAIQPRPSSEKIAAIAEKLELKKNVVRVWFCNQRQKQKRMKYSATH
ncbi:POU domain, class 4, transcription factor 3 [Hoplias malabaricus]|uniref:POU domain, class 4, transcription factor 3 n=1 Tax=Hoplias malabaricus TaxID=27720 RepID=UPI003461E095